ncbi:flagellar biosynthetic protein FliO [Propionivibrio soli]|uniref:flagellar biosynthetic protein FliO n=1 Tax=Propionivibrio soli TaxID=2976531 RepID=UPI0021E967D4|nr:flagellar biosynthetic protein FliO [Propionivibrio soli]
MTKPFHRFAAATFAAGSLALAPWQVFAQSAAVPETPGVPGSAMVQMLLALALIIGLLFLGAFFLRRMNGGQSFGNAGPLRVVGRLMLSPRERIVLLEVEETWVVVGIVPGQIKTLLTLPKGELPAAGTADNRFGHWLKQMTERHHGQA